MSHGFEYEVLAPVPGSTFASLVPANQGAGTVRLDLDQNNSLGAWVTFGTHRFKLAGLRTLGKQSSQEDMRAALDLLRTLQKADHVARWAERVQLLQVVLTRGSRQVPDAKSVSLESSNLLFVLEPQTALVIEGKSLSFIYMGRDLTDSQAYVHFAARSTAARILLFSPDGPELFKVADASQLKQAVHPNLHVVGDAAFAAHVLRLTT